MSQFGADNATFMSQIGTGFTHFPPPLFPHNHTFSGVLLGFLYVFSNKNSTGFGPFNRIDFDTVVMRGLHRGYKWLAVPKITEKRPYFGSLSRVHTYYTCLPVTPITALFTIQDGITILPSTEASCGVSTSMMTSS